MVRTRSFACAGLVVLSALLAAALGAPSAGAGTACWKDVLDDFSTTGGIRTTYAPSCYRDALEHLPSDLASYSSAPDEIQRALLAAVARAANAPAQAKPNAAAGDRTRRIASVSKPATRKTSAQRSGGSSRTGLVTAAVLAALGLCSAAALYLPR